MDWTFSASGLRHARKKFENHCTKLKTLTLEKTDQITLSIFYLQSMVSQELFQWTKKFLQAPYSKNNTVYKEEIGDFVLLLIDI